MGRTIISSTLPGASTKEKHLADAQFRMLRENDGIYMVRVIYKDSRDRAEAMDTTAGSQSSSRCPARFNLRWRVSGTSGAEPRRRASMSTTNLATHSVPELSHTSFRIQFVLFLQSRTADSRKLPPRCP